MLASKIFIRKDIIIQGKKKGDYVVYIHIKQSTELAQDSKQAEKTARN
jgi:hypothetical protein